MGMGKGRVKHFRPEEETDTSFFDTKASTKAGKGTADIVLAELTGRTKRRFTDGIDESGEGYPHSACRIR